MRVALSVECFDGRYNLLEDVLHSLLRKRLVERREKIPQAIPAGVLTGMFPYIAMQFLNL